MLAQFLIRASTPSCAAPCRMRLFGLVSASVYEQATEDSGVQLVETAEQELVEGEEQVVQEEP
uniref:Uncharacterized protein n=1 Tax=Zea mays TaxID=4577 RepID=B6TSX5_MAIZE|nr:hypothetical protein [Zea mays]